MAITTLLIGWDAADWKVINDLIAQDRLPHTRALIERGVMGDLATLRPVLSPLLWMTPMQLPTRNGGSVGGSTCCCNGCGWSCC